MTDLQERTDAGRPDVGGLLPTDIEAEGLSIRPKSFGRQTWERFVRHKIAIVALVVLVLIVISFWVGPAVAKYEFDEPNIVDARQGPSADHPFGTDELGRDLFARTLKGGQVSIQIAFTVALISTAIGTLLGALAGYFGKAVDLLISQIVNLFLIVPGLIILFVAAIRWGSSVRSVSILLGALLWVPIARLVRGQMLQLKEQEFVQAARAAGAGSRRIIVRHLLPNVIGPIVVQTTLIIGTAIILESTLAFFSLGVQPPDTSLGVLIDQGLSYVDTRPSGALIPGGFIVLIVLSINFLGDGLRDAFDPTTRRVRG